MGDASLSEEFRATAAACQANRFATTIDLLVTKYEILMRHAVADPAEKTSIADALFDCGAQMLRGVMATPRTPYAYISETVGEEVTQLLGHLLSKESVNFIPGRAPPELACTALEFIRQAESATEADFKDADNGDGNRTCLNYKERMTKLGEVTLSLADRFRDAIDNSSANVKTANPVTMSKPLTLKPATGEPA